MIHARTAWVRGTAACCNYRRDRVHSGCAVSTFFFRQQRVRAEPGVCHDSHADTWTPHLAAKQEKHRAGWLSRPAIFVSAYVCALRGESTCARAGLT
jgi:hypothetical protein